MILIHPTGGATIEILHQVVVQRNDRNFSFRSIELLLVKLLYFMKLRWQCLEYSICFLPYNKFLWNWVLHTFYFIIFRNIRRKTRQRISRPKIVNHWNHKQLNPHRNKAENNETPLKIAMFSPPPALKHLNYSIWPLKDRKSYVSRQASICNVSKIAK